MRAVRTAVAALLVLAWAAAMTFFILDTSRLGGNALAGGHETGPEGDVWYVAKKHGPRTVVSEADWRTNRGLEIGVLAGLPLLLGSFFYLLFSQVFRRGIYLRGDEDVGATARRVRATGAASSSTKTGAKLGWVGFGGPIVAVSVHPGGLHVKPPFLPAFGIERDRVRSVERRTTWKVPRTIVTHSSPDVRSPVIFEGKQDAAFAAALDHLAGRR